MIKPLCLTMLVAYFLTACATAGRDSVPLSQAEEVGFSQQEIIDFGQMVNLTYDQFHRYSSDFSPPAPDTFVAGYRATQNLHSQDKPSDSKREFYGYLARSNADPQHLIIAVRGTSDAAEWLDDVKFDKVPFSHNAKHGRVELGFKQVFDRFAISDFGSRHDVSLDEYLAALEDVSMITVVGHSLGSSLATLMAFDFSVKGYADEIRILTFASPRTGDHHFSAAFVAQVPNSLRVVNEPDLVPRVPPRLFKFRHVWHELKIDSRLHSRVKRSVTCFHSLSTYLYVLTRSQHASQFEPTAECLAL
ncbi:lipase family protein [Arenicella xantha]|uniref:Lipase (Class 3) n=1 Tax=Arenicella xantha TaxID=644221 RepID=A0A395JLU8_9GAMM|nr:lipase family protein [Arenicella xantha]RBP48760.1 lipase (class 3) [Arenicella xantha]